MAAPVYTPIDSANGEIRLLTLEPANNVDDPIVCSLEQVFLSENPVYEALSYTWGSPTPTCQLQLNGRTVDVQENAAAAMRRLRSTTAPRKLWIDAICTNQAHLAEKEGQLPLMCSVYEQAEQVVVWLGEPLDSTIMAISDLKSRFGIRTASFAGGVTKGVGSRYLANLVFPSYPVRHLNFKSGSAWMRCADLEDELDVGDIREIMHRPWWKRIWVIQEAVVAKKLVFVIGSDTFELEHLRRSIDRMRTLRVGVEAFGIVVNPEVYSAQDETFRIIVHLRDLWRNGRFFIHLHDLMYEFRHLHCTNDRDRVFGFLGLASAGGKNLGIVPDYTSSVSSVYIHSARSVVRSSGYLDMLTRVREWRGVDAPPSYFRQAFSLVDQARYHDVAAPVCSAEDPSKIRFGWARLPPGWERIEGPDDGSSILTSWSRLKKTVKGQTAKYLDHNTNTLHDKSPLDGLPPTPGRHVSSQREIPDGWVKTWDNLGRAQIRYDPALYAATVHAPYVPDATALDLAANLPSWVPNWSVHTHLDARPLLDWLDKSPRYWASGHTVAVVSPPSTPSTLSVQGVPFDTILALSAPWHPKPSDPPPLTRRAAPVLEAWEALALDTSLFAPHPCPYVSTASRSTSALNTTTTSTPLTTPRATALWRTYLGDPPSHLSTPLTPGRALMSLWYDRPLSNPCYPDRTSSWTTRLPSPDELAEKSMWATIEGQGDVERMDHDLHRELREREGEEFPTKGTEGVYGGLAMTKEKKPNPRVPGSVPDNDTIFLTNLHTMINMTRPAMTVSLRTTTAPAPAAFLACIARTNTPTAASMTRMAPTRYTMENDWENRNLLQ
ncbi:heterokaryon incompatibility protein-domain-containing protein [Schizothecium vesticola]|uniref:Heterokaryon incompatibility protein-domain-containing protein n=1 Tax=Schizothecium vesticola TaxID=314040 RepID=A0AA40F807_9PEZI|nr:heterokaryon incompatibility protein-domain-containing protein [Schizothecium vesticola]